MAGTRHLPEDRGTGELCSRSGGQRPPRRGSWYCATRHPRPGAAVKPSRRRWSGVGGLAPPSFYFLFPLPSVLQGDCNAGNPSSCRQEPCAPRLYPVSCTNDSLVPAVQIFRSLARSPVGESASVLERAGWAPTGSRALPLPRVCWRPHPRPSQLARSFLVAPAGAARLSHTAGRVTARGFPDAPWASLGFPWL